MLPSRRLVFRPGLTALANTAARQYGDSAIREVWNQAERAGLACDGSCGTEITSVGSGSSKMHPKSGLTLLPYHQQQAFGM
jgi:hypothetical protein